jgi:uncharacterized DUF497 family protein
MILFEWDEAKAESNRRKHGISFDYAAEAFYDPFAIYEQDRVVGGEERWQVIGVSEAVALLVVVHLIREEGADEVVRIISARRANRTEQRRYGKNHQKDQG